MRHSTVLSAALTIASASAGTTAHAQGPVFNPTNGHYYESIDAPMISWTDARAAAESMSYMGLDGHLVTFSDLIESDWVYANVSGNLNRFWIGGFQDKTSPDYSEPDGGWTWVTGEPVAFTNWFPGEPNNFGGNEDFMTLDHNQPEWNDIIDDWSISRGYIVEYEQLPEIYCTAKTNSCNLLPMIGFTGSASATQNDGFEVFATRTKGLKPGVLLYSDSGRAALPFQGGVLCVNTVNLRRTIPLIETNGSPPMCNGVLSIDMNAFATGGLGGNPLPSLLVPGTVVNGQFWARDSIPIGSLLSDALEYWIGP